ncbi:uncharacterized protein [Paramormyrops kingsleyae]|uniref:uncharacterized protein isoform X2 n=1 Tax=Paramormyrops kingsleyae TaxID=1676925 RepID=UPI003B96FCA1
MPQLEGEQLSGAQELQGRLAWMGVERRLLATPLRAPGSQWERLLPRRDPQDEKTGNHISADPGALEVDAGDRAREQKEEEVEEGDEERQKLEPQRAFRQLDLRQVLMREFPEENDVPRISRGIHTLSMERMPMHAQCLPEHTVLNYMDRSNRHGHTFSSVLRMARRLLALGPVTGTPGRNTQMWPIRGKGKISTVMKYTLTKDASILADCSSHCTKVAEQAPVGISHCM